MVKSGLCTLSSVPTNLNTQLSGLRPTSLVKGYGRYADVTAITECYKFYKFHAHKFGKDNKAVEMYAALATAFFDANVPGAALAFYQSF